MQKKFDTILDFTKLRDKCLFCETPLRAALANYINPRENSLPVLDVTINSGRFAFQIKHTTQSYDIKADGVIDIRTNAMVFTLPVDADMPFLDQHVAKQAFVDLKPHIELSCPNSKCKNEYSLSSHFLTAVRLQKVNAWMISPPIRLFLETFRAGNLVVQNDWIVERTNIYSRLNEDADPIKVPFMDFEAMGKTKLLTRVQTLVTFS